MLVKWNVSVLATPHLLFCNCGYCISANHIFRYWNQRRRSISHDTPFCWFGQSFYTRVVKSTNVGISPQERSVTRWAQALTSTAYKSGITARPKDGDPEGAADFTAEDWIGFSSLWAYQLPNPTGLCQSATKTVRRRCSSDRDRISDNLLLFCLITAFR